MEESILNGEVFMSESLTKALEPQMYVFSLTGVKILSHLSQMIHLENQRSVTVHSELCPWKMKKVYLFLFFFF